MTYFEALELLSNLKTVLSDAIIAVGHERHEEALAIKRASRAMPISDVLFLAGRTQVNELSCQTLTSVKLCAERMVKELSEYGQQTQAQKPSTPPEKKIYYCTICHKNVVDALHGEDTCEECLIPF